MNMKLNQEKRGGNNAEGSVEQKVQNKKKTVETKKRNQQE
jgi:hypothetical protein